MNSVSGELKVSYLNHNGDRVEFPLGKDCFSKDDNSIYSTDSIKEILRSVFNASQKELSVFTSEEREELIDAITTATQGIDVDSKEKELKLRGEIKEVLQARANISSNKQKGFFIRDKKRSSPEFKAKLKKQRDKNKKARKARKKKRK